MLTLKVKWYNDSKGYGFLDHDNRDVFVHYTAIQGPGYRTLVEGQTVECEVMEGPKGPQAVNVSKRLDIPLECGHSNSGDPGEACECVQEIDSD